MQIQISWLLKKPTDLDLHCLQNRIYPGSAGQGLKVSKQVENVYQIKENGNKLSFELHAYFLSCMHIFNLKFRTQLFKANDVIS